MGIGCALQPVSCSDSNVCTVDSCSPKNGCTYSAASPTVCDDGNPCTTDACTPAGCTHVAHTEACNDGNACTQKDRCSEGHCVGGSSKKCGAGDACHEAGICDPATGLCEAATRPNGTACSDLKPCTTEDTCVNGACVGTPVKCPPGLCQVASCNPETGLCVSTPAGEGSTCSDGDACTQTDTCQAGTCVGANPVECGPQVPCSSATCDPATGVCAGETLANGSSCSDGVACTLGDACEAGSCQAGPCPINVVCGGVDPCACAVGYTGPGCTGCAPGYSATNELLATSNVSFLPAALLSDSGALVGLAGTGPYATNALLGLRADGSVFAASHTNPAHLIPVSASSGVTQLTASFTHAVALKSDGTVIAWGQDPLGAAVVPALPGVASAVAAGGSRSAALLADGHVVLWGGNPSSPLPAAFLTSLAQGGITAIAVGSTNLVAALKSDGSVLTPWWPVTQTWTQVTAIAAGFNQILALTSSGAVLAVGSSPYGEADVPAAALSGVVAIAAAGHHSLALKADGSVIGWGRGYEGQLNLPVAPVGATRIFATGFASYVEIGGCGLSDECVDGTAVCDPNATCFDTVSGYDCVCDPGFAGDGTSCVADCAASEDGTSCSDGVACTLGDACEAGSCQPGPCPINVVCGGVDPCACAVGYTGPGCTGCAPGYSATNELLATSNVGFLPAALLSDSSALLGLAGTGPYATNALLGLRADGSVFAASHTNPAHLIPASASSGVTQLAASFTHAVALKSDGTVIAWGQDPLGAAVVPALPGVASAVAAGGSRSAALLADGHVVLWGGNPSSPLPAAFLTSLAQGGITAIAVGSTNLVAALKSDGSVLTPWWPVTQTWTQVTAIAAGFNQILALTSSGAVLAVGSSPYGEADVPAAALSGVVAIAASGHHSLALKADGSVIGWGRGYEGQLNLPVGPVGATRIFATGFASYVEIGGCGLSDECVDGTAVCDPNATCFDTISGYDCVCDPGFAGDGTSCAVDCAASEDGTPCGDADPCTTADACADGVCGGSPVVCDAEGPCHLASTCEPNPTGAGYVCLSSLAPNGATCEDGDLCTVGDACETGKCRPGIATLCEDGEDCQSVKSCDPTTGQCPTAMLPDGTPCDDGVECTLGDECFGGLCSPGVCPLNLDCSTEPGCGCAVGYTGPACDVCEPGFAAVSRPLEWGGSGHFVALQSLAEGVTSVHGFIGSRIALTASGGVVVDTQSWNPVRNVPPSVASGVSKVVIANRHALALKNGEVIAWGFNGLGATTVPPAALTGVTDIAVSYENSFALLGNGTVVVWGSGPYVNPSDLSALNAGTVTAIAGAHIGAVALRSDGHVNFTSHLHTSVVWSGVTAVDAGERHALGLTASGAVLCTAYVPHYGECDVPASASSGVIAIAAGGNHSVALKADGSIVTWGYNVPGGLDVPTLPASPTGIAATQRNSYAFLQICEDIDECSTGAAQCDPNATCTNTLGGYDCTCLPGYLGNGFECEFSCSVAANGVLCDDGDPCTGVSLCQAGLCVGTPIVCDSEGPCSKPGICNPKTGKCSPPTMAPDGTTCDDGDACTKGDICKSGGCVSATVSCPPLGPCYKPSFCDPESGACTELPLSNDTPCDDGEPCTQKDWCQDGKCVGTSPLLCPSDSPCRNDGTCKAKDGKPFCAAGADLPNLTPCSDENVCTTGDACKTGVCVGSVRQCPSSDPCIQKGTCDPATGSCKYPDAPPGTPCEDGDICTLGDACEDGACEPGLFNLCPP